MTQWLIFIHIVGVFAFLVAHGSSVGVLFRLRSERDPGRINALLQLSTSSIQLFYWSTGLLVAAIGLDGGLPVRVLDDRPCRRQLPALPGSV